jgi:ribosome-associated heat shock protein Hsp15
MPPAAAHRAVAMSEPAARLRLDKWLWHARFARTRSRSAELVGTGHVRINGQRVTDPAKAVRVGDILTLALEGRTTVVKVLALPARRGPFEEARLAYETLS